MSSLFLCAGASVIQAPQWSAAAQLKVDISNHVILQSNDIHN